MMPNRAVEMNESRLLDRGLELLMVEGEEMRFSKHLAPGILWSKICSHLVVVENGTHHQCQVQSNRDASCVKRRE